LFMIIKEIINRAVERTGRTAENVLAVEVLLAFCLNVEREDLFMDHESEVSGECMEKFEALFGRFFAGEPVAYLTNKKEFYGLDFYVDNNVLIPRPETELLVEEVLKLVEPDEVPARILDVGTGSGCIAVALAKKLDKAILTATDVSTGALEVAKKNAGSHGVSGKIEFVVADLMEGIGGPFDIIVANLPYIGEKRFNFVSREAREFEPHVALFGGDDGLGPYKRLFNQVSSQTWRPRYLLGEFGFLQGEEMRDLLGKYFGGNEIRVVKDYASIDRIFMVGFKPQT
jgi:release factor glutamine methyltransferase